MLDTYKEVEKLEDSLVSENVQSIAGSWVDNGKSMHLCTEKQEHCLV